MAMGVDGIGKLNSQISGLSGTLSQNEKDVNLFEKKSIDSSDNVQISEQSKGEAGTKLASSESSLKALSGSLEGANMALDAAKTKLQNDPENKDLKELVAIKQESADKLSKQIEEATQLVEASKTAYNDAETALTTASEEKTVVESELAGKETELTENTTKMTDLKAQLRQVTAEAEVEEKKFEEDNLKLGADTSKSEFTSEMDKDTNVVVSDKVSAAVVSETTNAGKMLGGIAAVYGTNKEEMLATIAKVNGGNIYNQDKDGNYRNDAAFESRAQYFSKAENDPKWYEKAVDYVHGTQVSDYSETDKTLTDNTGGTKYSYSTAGAVSTTLIADMGGVDAIAKESAASFGLNYDEMDAQQRKMLAYTVTDTLIQMSDDTTMKNSSSQTAKKDVTGIGEHPKGDEWELGKVMDEVRKEITNPTPLSQSMDVSDTEYIESLDYKSANWDISSVKNVPEDDYLANISTMDDKNQKLQASTETGNHQRYNAINSLTALHDANRDGLSSINEIAANLESIGLDPRTLLSEKQINLVGTSAGDYTGYDLNKMNKDSGGAYGSVGVDYTDIYGENDITKEIYQYVDKLGEKMSDKQIAEFLNKNKGYDLSASDIAQFRK